MPSIYTRQPTEETLLTGKYRPAYHLRRHFHPTNYLCSGIVSATPTSLVFLNPQDTDLSVPGGGIHPLNEGYVNHELVPILTMDPNATTAPNVLAGGATTSVGGATLSLRTSHLSRDHFTAIGLATPTATATTTSAAAAAAAEATMMDGRTMAMAPEMSVMPACAHKVGVYTLAEEPELEGDDAAINRI